MTLIEASGFHIVRFPSFAKRFMEMRFLATSSCASKLELSISREFVRLTALVGDRRSDIEARAPADSST